MYIFNATQTTLVWLPGKNITIRSNTDDPNALFQASVMAIGSATGYDTATASYSPAEFDLHHGTYAECQAYLTWLTSKLSNLLIPPAQLTSTPLEATLATNPNPDSF